MEVTAKSINAFKTGIDTDIFNGMRGNILPLYLAWNRLLKQMWMWCIYLKYFRRNSYINLKNVLFLHFRRNYTESGKIWQSSEEFRKTIEYQNCDVDASIR